MSGMASSLGIHCSVEKGAINCNAVYVESADGHTPDNAEQVVTFRGSRSASPAQQLVELHDKLASELADLQLDAVVIRSADFHRSRGTSAAADLRAQAEGVALLAGQANCDRTVAMRGKDVGVAYGSDKASAEDRGRTVLPDGDQEACAAAIAGLRM